MTCNCPEKQSNDDVRYYDIKYLQNCLLTLIMVIEKYGSSDKCMLNGWTKEMIGKMDDYRSVLEKLREKYKHIFAKHMEPENELLFRIIVDGNACHIKNICINNNNRRW